MANNRISPTPRYAVVDIRNIEIAWFIWVSDANNFVEAQATPTAYRVVEA